MDAHRPDAPRRHIALGLFMHAADYHEAGWRHPGARSATENIHHLRDIATLAELGKLHMLFFPDGLSTSADTHPSMLARLESLTALSALAMHTQRIGLAGSTSTTYGEPVHVARAFASLDHLSGGRAGGLEHYHFGHPARGRQLQPRRAPSPCAALRARGRVRRHGDGAMGHLGPGCARARPGLGPLRGSCAPAQARPCGPARVAGVVFTAQQNLDTARRARALRAPAVAAGHAQRADHALAPSGRGPERP